LLSFSDHYNMQRNIIISSAIFIVTFFIYVLTMCPTIYWDDSAAFCAANSVLGIPHPPSFPIYVILGRIFTLLPIESYAFRSNLMSAFWGSASLVLLFFLIIKIISYVSNKDSQLKMLEKDSHLSILKIALLPLSAISGVLTFGLTTAFWLQAVRAEVYTLNIFFTMLLLTLVVSWSTKARCQQKDSFRILAVLCFIYGLSWANHSLLVAALFPAFFLFVLLTDHKSILHRKKTPLLIFLFFCGISVYLFLLIRSRAGAVINWSNPGNWGNFFSSITRSHTLSSAVRQISAPYENRLWFCLSFIVQQYSLPFFGWGVLGAVKSMKSFGKMTFLLFGVFGFNILTATWAADFTLINLDIQAYLLPALAIFAIWISFAFYYTTLFLRQIALNKGTLLKTAALGLCLAIMITLPIYQLVRNYADCDKSKAVWLKEFAQDILDSMKGGSIIISTDDYTLSPFWYLKYVEKVRTDIRILPIVMLDNSKKLKFMKENYTDLKLPHLDKPEPRELKKERKLGLEFCQDNVEHIRIYYPYGLIDRNIAKHSMPSGYICEFSKDEVVLNDSIMNAQWNFFKERFTPEKVERFDPISRDYFSDVLYNISVYYSSLGNSDRSFDYLELALKVDPSNSTIYLMLGAALLAAKEYDRSLKSLEVAVELDPYNEEIYFRLARCYFEMKDYGKSKEMLEKGLKINPRNQKLRKALMDMNSSLKKME
jgi:tetratricopeptide (TPR) repeat protein